MNPEQNRRVEALFDRLCDLPLEEAIARLETECADDDAVRKEVARLLASAAATQSTLNDQLQQVLGEAVNKGLKTTSAPEQIGPYKILRTLGEGGMGTVYLAEQTEPVHRRVALKLIKAGMDSKAVIARFEAERQALAMMDHPCVAKVLDAGTTERGLPYFVMEHVPGVPITEHCDRQRLNIKQRIDLFRRVCEAVQHAHQKGIIHRDIKPSNILVTVRDGKATPKVIDFGVAKAVHQKLTEATLFTAQGQIVGTPEYMSPEQAEMTAQDIDTRSDIYSLGVLLYELLTGALPFDPKTLRKAAFVEIQRIIREQEPPRPSTRLSSLGEASSANAKARHVDLRILERELRGDLDWIVMKALEKDRTRRYDTANGLAADLLRYLQHEPVLAGPPSATYKMKKFVQRNRAGVTAAAIVLFVLLAGIGGTSIGIVQATRSRAQATAAKTQAEAARNQEAAARASETKQRILAQEATATAETQKNNAEQAAAAEAEARKLADQRATEAEEANHKAQWQTYLADIYAADAFEHDNQLAAAEERLDAAPKEFRNWEWNYLHSQLDQSITPVLIEDGQQERIVWISSDAKRAVAVAPHTDGKDDRYTIWNLETEKPIAKLQGQSEQMNGIFEYSIEFNRDGNRIFATSKNDSKQVEIITWDAITGQLLTSFDTGDAETFSFSPDGSKVVMVPTSGHIALIWDTATGEQLVVLRGHESRVNSASFSPDGSKVVTASDDDTVRIWDAATGEQLVVLRGHESRVNSASFSPDGSKVVTASDDDTVRIWDAATGEQLVVLRGHESRVNSASFSPDGSKVVTGSWDHTARIWDAATGKQLVVLKGHEDIVNSASFSPDGSKVVTGSWDHTARIWDATTGQQIRLFAAKGIRWSVFSSNGRFVFTKLAFSSGIQIWDAKGGEQPLVLKGHEDPVNSAFFSPDSSKVVTASDDDTARIWDVATGEQLVVLRGHKKMVSTASFSPDGSKVVTASDDETARIWDVATGEQLVILKGHKNTVITASFSPDGSKVATTSLDDTARIWNTATGEQLVILKGHTGWIITASFNPDGSKVVTASNDGTARIWDATTGEQLVILKLKKQRFFFAYIVTAFFSPDGLRVVTTCTIDHTIRIWDASTGKLLSTTNIHGKLATMSNQILNFDGKRMVTSSDGRVYIHDTSTGNLFLTFSNGSTDSKFSSFSPDGTKIADTRESGEVYIWDSAPYRERYWQRQAYVNAEPEATELLDHLQATIRKEHGVQDWHLIADTIRSDTTISQAVRHVAMNLLMKRANAIQLQAQQLITNIKKHFIFKDDILAAIRNDPSVEPAILAAALHAVAIMGEPSPDDLYTWANDIVNDDGRTSVDYEQARRAAEVAFKSDPANFDFCDTLVTAWLRLDQLDRAAEVWQKHVENVRKEIPVDKEELASALIQYGMVLMNNGKAEEAEPVLRECLAIREKVLVNTNDDWLIANTQSTLGGCLTKLDRFAEAEPLLIASAEALEKNDNAPEDKKTEAIQRVIDLYAAWDTAEPGQGHAAKADPWRAKLPKADANTEENAKENTDKSTDKNTDKPTPLP